MKTVLVIAGTRPKAVEAGFAQVAGTDKQKILAAIRTALTRPKELPYMSPFGDGKAAEKIMEISQKEL